MGSVESIELSLALQTRAQLPCKQQSLRWKSNLKQIAEKSPLGSVDIWTRYLLTGTISVVTIPSYQLGLLLAKMVGPFKATNSPGTSQRSPKSYWDGLTWQALLGPVHKVTKEIASLTPQRYLPCKLWGSLARIDTGNTLKLHMFMWMATGNISQSRTSKRLGVQLLHLQPCTTTTSTNFNQMLIYYYVNIVQDWLFL